MTNHEHLSGIDLKVEAAIALNKAADGRAAKPGSATHIAGVEKLSELMATTPDGIEVVVAIQKSPEPKKLPKQSPDDAAAIIHIADLLSQPGGVEKILGSNPSK